MKRILRTVALLVVLCALVLPALPAQAQSGNTWALTYWPNTTMSGYSPFTATASILSFNWGEGAPMSGMPVDNWTMRATSSVWFNAGTYNFTAQADDEVSLMINGVTWLNTNGQGMSGKVITVTVPLSVSGWYNLQVDFREFTGAAYLFVNWIMIGTAAPPPPVSTEPVPSATSVVTRYGDYTPCIEQGIHQSNCFVSDGEWDSPDMGSIEMEPQIVIWGNCTANTIQSMVMFTGMPPQNAKCSKTDAGWFPM